MGSGALAQNNAAGALLSILCETATFNRGWASLKKRGIEK